MINIYIEPKFLESNKVPEHYFLESLIKKLNIQKEFKFNSLNGWNGIVKLKNIILDQSKHGKSLFILDADFEGDNPWLKRKTEVEQILASFNIDYELFLYPNNNNEGEFEDLLESIIPENQKYRLECFKQYENCIKTQQDFYTPSKSRVYAYFYSFIKNKKDYKKHNNSSDWDFENPIIWDLESSELIPLMDFLKTNF